jgi:peptidylprolyl isomerase
MVGMGRQADPNSANSGFYFMLGSARALDHGYTLFGRVLAAEMSSMRWLSGSHRQPDRMIRVRNAFDLSAADRPRLEVMDVESREYARFAAARRRSHGPSAH